MEKGHSNSNGNDAANKLSKKQSETTVCGPEPYQKGHRHPNWTLSPNQAPIHYGCNRQPSVQRRHGGGRNAATRSHSIQKCDKSMGRHPPINITPRNMLRPEKIGVFSGHNFWDDLG